MAKWVSTECLAQVQVPTSKQDHIITWTLALSWVRISRFFWIAGYWPGSRFNEILWLNYDTIRIGDRGRASQSVSLPWVCLQGLSRVTPMSHQYDCPIMSSTGAAWVDIPEWLGKDHKTTTLHKELQVIRNAESGRNSLPQERTQQLIINTKC